MEAEIQGKARLLLWRVLESITDPLVIYDHRLRVMNVNRAVSDLFGIPAEQLHGKGCCDLFEHRNPSQGDCYLQNILKTGEPGVRESQIKLRDGTLRHFELNAFPVKTAQGAISQIVEHARDITSKKELERDLRSSEQRYRTIVEMAREGIYIVDQNAKITFANRRLARILGYAPEQILGAVIFDFMDEEARQIAREKFERRRQGLSDIYELRFTRNDGSILYGLVSVAPLMDNETFLGAIGIVTDITCLKRTEAALRSAKAFSEKIINSITDNLVVIDPRTYRIVQANEPLRARVGISEMSELSGRLCYEILLSRDKPCEEDGIFCPVRETMRLKQPVLSDTPYGDLKRHKVFQLSTYPILNDQSEVELVIRLERDITEKQKMEKALAFRSKELHKTQARLETLFEISRQISTKSTLAELIGFLHETTLKIFPASDPLIFLLNVSGDGFLRLESSDRKIVEPVWQKLQRLDQCGLTAAFLQFTKKTRSGRIHKDGDSGVPPFLKVLAEDYPAWFAFCISVQQQCIGAFCLGSKTFQTFSQEDMRFVHAYFEQASGYIRQLVLHGAELDHLRSQVAERTAYGDIIGHSKVMQEVYELIDLVSSSDATVLITGENGTGKELVAHAIHTRSHRHKGPFVVANCSAYSPTLLESELFGHEKGAFTGAIRQKKGRIERAHGGTLFLDEIGDIVPATQILLLRFLQDHCFERVGGEKTIATDVRVLAATNKDLQKEVQARTFRDDLYYRLNVISIHLPSLRDRKEDIPILAQHFLKKYNFKEQKSIQKFSSNAMQALMDYDWPGNVRQLENAVSHAVILSQGDMIRRRHLPRFLREGGDESTPTTLEENERLLIQRALQESNWNKHEAARRLNVSRSTLYSKIRRYGLERAESV